MLIALPLTMGVVSCVESDNAVTQLSAVDDKEWKADDNKDTSVRPGDDFFMYCNGGFWNRTVLTESVDCHMLLMDQSEEWIKQTKESLTIPSSVKLKADVMLTDAATVTAEKTTLQNALDRINAVTTKKEAWQLAGQLMKEGFYGPFSLHLFSYNGKIGVVFSGAESNAYDTPSLGAFKNTLSWQLGNNPDVLACIRPLKRAGTRSFDQAEWPMIEAAANALGLPLDLVFTAEKYPPIIQNNLIEQSLALLHTYQDMSVEKFKSTLYEIVNQDTVLYDDDALKAATKQSRSKVIDNMINRYLKYETSRIFADAVVTDQMKQCTRNYCRQMQDVMRERIQNNDWMSEGSKKNAIEKLDAMVFNTGAPDEWFDEGIADLSKENNVLNDVRALRRANNDLIMKLLGMDSPRASFHLMILQFPLTTMNAFYNPNTNSCNIYPVWQVKPMWDPEQSDAHNYANMMFYGHEITHGFDPGGAQYDKKGDLNDIWANDADRKEFEKRSQQMIDYFSSLDVMPFETGLKNDGAFTNDENVADLGGFFLAYESYVKLLKQQGFKGEQLLKQRRRFYEAYGNLWCGKWTAGWARENTVGDPNDPTAKDNHSLGRERVNGIVTNTDDWYDLFDVKAGDKLYLAPDKRIRIW